VSEYSADQQIDLLKMKNISFSLQFQTLIQNFEVLSIILYFNSIIGNRSGHNQSGIPGLWQTPSGPSTTIIVIIQSI
jgi:hypothetical protein